MGCRYVSPRHPGRERATWCCRRGPCYKRDLRKVLGMFMSHERMYYINVLREQKGWLVLPGSESVKVGRPRFQI